MSGLEKRKKSMIIVTYEQWYDGDGLYNGYYEKNTVVYNDKSELQKELMYWIDKGNPMLISGIWEV